MKTSHFICGIISLILSLVFSISLLVCYLEGNLLNVLVSGILLLFFSFESHVIFSKAYIDKKFKEIGEGK